jgi:hypothetical protein
MAANDAAQQVAELRRLKAWDLRVQGKSYREIGEALQVSHVTAWDDVKIIVERLQAEQLESIDHHRRMQLTRLDKAISVIMPMLDDPGTALEAIDRLDKLEKRRAALFGLDAPTKQELTGKDGAPLIDANPAEAARLIRQSFGEHALKNEIRDSGPGSDGGVPPDPSAA